MAKISKTYTIEEETMKIVKENKENRNLSSDSASLERIVLEWAVLKGNNSGLSNIDIDKIVDKVLEKLNINGKNIYNEIEEVEEKTDYENSINDMISDMPD
ncbi:MAG: hypothetical protein SPH93_14210 [Clostridium sp.]|uniref:hypothetical protein n=1 Tax=Clostridium sp. TaxID=1506 RepID=UPI002A90A5B2|nr:hypothetical protein [Clostridium sp.]MDY6228790.1 hypothetical protein [Clostridium sp.]